MCIWYAYVLEHVENEEVLENKREEPWKIAKILNWSEGLGLSILDQKRKQKKVLPEICQRETPGRIVGTIMCEITINTQLLCFYEKGLLGSGGVNIDLFSVAMNPIHWWGPKKVQTLKSSPLSDWVSKSGWDLGIHIVFSAGGAARTQLLLSTTSLPLKLQTANYFLVMRSVDL